MAQGAVPVHGVRRGGREEGGEGGAAVPGLLGARAPRARRLAGAVAVREVREARGVPRARRCRLPNARVGYRETGPASRRDRSPGHGRCSTRQGSRLVKSFELAVEIFSFNCLLDRI